MFPPPDPSTKPAAAKSALTLPTSGDGHGSKSSGPKPMDEWRQAVVANRRGLGGAK